MKSAAIAIVLLLHLAPAAAENLVATPKGETRTGIDLQYLDAATRPQDDFFRYVSGKWLDHGEIPADKARYGAFDLLRDTAEKQLRDIVEGLAADGGISAGSDERKIADLYASFMDVPMADSRGLQPLQEQLAGIDALTDKAGIPALIARLSMTGAAVPLALSVSQDARDSTRYAIYLSQGGLGLPDRDYYLKDDDAKLKAMREAYRSHVSRVLALAGQADTAQAAQRILDLETEIARAQWTKVENRDPLKTYNRKEISALGGLIGGYDWPAYFTAAGVGAKVDYVIVRQPSYLAGLSQLLDRVPLPQWKAYFKWHLIDAYAPYLSQAYADEDFAFNGGTLRGIPENRPRWKRGLALVEESVGEALGRLYVARHFPAQNKARIRELVRNLLGAYRQSIATLDWMGPATRRQALDKLDKFNAKVGYPERWRDYGALRIERGDLVGNVARAREFEFRRRLAKLGHPVDRDEWEMTPQTVNAYYDPRMNEVVFPAAILQPPFFDAGADDAANYGGIGAVIGHEISHGFDDQGSRYDGDGNLRDWWTQDDHEQFALRTKVLVAQYGAYSPVPGYQVNGELTLGENIADNSGLAIAYKAYRIALGGAAAPSLGGFSGDQRFCLGWGQVWRGKARDAEAIRLVKVDPHSPFRFRANGTLANLPAFYSAFGVKPGDAMYLAPEKRVTIW